MVYDILVQPQTEGEFRATVLGWPNLAATGQSEKVAVQRVTKALREQLSHSKVIQVLEEELNGETNDGEHPWEEFLGMWAEDKTFDDFVQKMEEYRQSQNQE